MQPHPISGIPMESIRVMWEDSVLPVQWVNCPNLQPKVWEFNRNDRGEIPNANFGPTRVKRAKCCEWPGPCCKYIFTRDAMLNHMEHRCEAPRAPHHPIPCPFNGGRNIHQKQLRRWQQKGRKLNFIKN